MRSLFAGVLLAAAAVASHAQEGFPLDGTWRGDVKVGSATSTVVIVMQWDGQKITGQINPGPDAMELTDAKLTPEGWRVTLAAKNKAGKDVTFEGAIENLGSYSRSINGTWTEAGRSAPIKLTHE